MSGFQGFPLELFTLFEGLAEDNSKSYWEANKATWNQKVRDPMKALLAELEGEFPPLRLLRPNRDLRFSNDRSPYKLWVAAASESEAIGGIGYYLRLGATGLVTGCGAMHLASDQLRRFRSALDDERSGQSFVELATQLAAKSLPVTHGAQPSLATAPAGYPKTHPRIEFLRWKGAVIVKEYDRAGWLSTREALDKVREVWHGAAPLMEWLGTNVGTSQPASVPSSARGGQA